MEVNGFDAAHVYTTAVLPGEDAETETFTAIQARFTDFLRNFRFGTNFIYRDQLRQNLVQKKFFLEVDLAHLISFDEGLANQLRDKPKDYLPLFENAIKLLGKQSYDEDVPDCQVMILSNANPIPLRDLNSEYISKLVRIPGIIIAASNPMAKATQIHAICRGCRHVKILPVNSGFAGVQLPRQCDAPKDVTQAKSTCPLDPYAINHDKSLFVDQQSLKLQELPDMIPVGELPRHILLSADRYLTDRVVPGTRATITGIYSIFSSKDNKLGAIAIRSSYIRVVGMQIDIDGTNRFGRSFTEEEEEEYLRMSRNPNLYEEFCNSIAPSIYGSQDIKKAIACLLFGGSRNVLPDGVRLRGDVNVLLLGDPGTAKSQLLKFVEKVAPIAVYTSGKGSSAAGLTASVVRDSGSREFYLEGGAMVLADGGVVCIDEFDKMREEDRVAIHEAMEQQTISIAKAGITTILNSRTSVLAAANPVFGRYDDMKSPGENIEFQSTILSRFDMIFIVRDEHNEIRDKNIARHVINVHKNTRIAETGTTEFDIQKMRGYIGYCRTKCAPRITEAAGQKLVSHFVEVRSKLKGINKNESEARNGVPITIRQLEAIVRISESLAKMSLATSASERHVDEAIRLFNISTLQAIRSSTSGDGVLTPMFIKEVDSVQQYVLRRLPRGSRITQENLLSDLNGQGFSSSSIDRAIYNLVRKDVLTYRDRRMVLRRIA